MQLRQKRRLLVVGAALAVAGVAAAIAYAAIPSGGVITACYVKSGGALRVIDTSVTSCKSNESKLEWGQQGRDGVSGYELVSKSEDFGANVGSFFGGLSVNCPTGKKALGGGATARTDGGAVTSGYNVLQTGPKPDGSGWTAVFDIENSVIDEDFTLTVYATCASVTP